MHSIHEYLRETREDTLMMSDATMILYINSAITNV